MFRRWDFCSHAATAVDVGRAERRDHCADGIKVTPPAAEKSDDAERTHGIGDFLEAGDIGAAHIVDRTVGALTAFGA